MNLDSLRSLSGWSFHHLGLACKSLDTERAALEAIGYEPVSGDIDDPRLGVKVCFLEGGGPRIELVAPLSGDMQDGSDVLEGWLSRGAKIYHLAYTVDNFASITESRLGRRAKLILGPTPAAAFDGRLIAFLMLRDGLLIELIETGMSG